MNISTKQGIVSIILIFLLIPIFLSIILSIENHQNILAIFFTDQPELQPLLTNAPTHPNNQTNQLAPDKEAKNIMPGTIKAEEKVEQSKAAIELINKYSNFTQTATHTPAASQNNNTMDPEEQKQLDLIKLTATLENLNN